MLCACIRGGQSPKDERKWQWLDSGVVLSSRRAALGISIPISLDSLASRTGQELMDAGQQGQARPRVLPPSCPRPVPASPEGHWRAESRSEPRGVGVGGEGVCVCVYVCGDLIMDRLLLRLNLQQVPSKYKCSFISHDGAQLINGPWLVDATKATVELMAPGRNKMSAGLSVTSTPPPPPHLTPLGSWSWQTGEGCEGAGVLLATAPAARSLVSGGVTCSVCGGESKPLKFCCG